MTGDALLRVENLRVDAWGRAGPQPIVEDMSYEVRAGQTLGIVGESGSGKSVGVRALLGLIETPPLRVGAGTAMFEGEDLLAMKGARLREILGRRVSFVFQDPLSSLNPLQRCGDQIREAVRLGPALSEAARAARVSELLRAVGISDPERRARQYPHEFSGGMRQRIMIAIALANEPALIIADEPTTALDVTIQAQIMDLFREIRRTRPVALILISHDLGLVAENTDRVLVLYAGRVMETGDTGAVLAAPRHPYTASLLRSRPAVGERSRELRFIPGQPPSVGRRPGGCPFHPRCFLGQGRTVCSTEVPMLRAVAGSSNLASCHFAEELALIPQAAA